MNLAEVGQSTMRNDRKKMWLTEAAFQDNWSFSTSKFKIYKVGREQREANWQRSNTENKIAAGKSIGTEVCG